MLCHRWKSSCDQSLFRGTCHTLKFSSVSCLVTRGVWWVQEKFCFIFRLSIFFLLLGWKWCSLGSFYTLRRIKKNLNSLLSFKEIKKRNLSFVFTHIFTIFSDFFFSSCLNFYLFSFLFGLRDFFQHFLDLLAVNVVKISCIWKWFYFVFIFWKIIHQIQNTTLTALFCFSISDH